MEKFLKFATKKGAENIAEQHRERALPLADFSEIYRRYAKASLFIGDHTDEVNDSNVGMEVEFVITSASKVENGSQRLRVRLLYQGQALGNAMITLFSRDATGKVEKTIDKTSPDGTITVTAEAGYFYLLDHVVIRCVDQDAMAQFYRDLLGCTVDRHNKKLDLLQLRAGSHLIDLIAVDGVLGRRGGTAPGSE
ncbi:MAG: VOC family protein, partial [Alphaproteobacteria bacterium]